MPVDIFDAKQVDFTWNDDIPSMLSGDERALYYTIARDYSGRGAVYELGPWLGSSTIQICRGLELAGHSWKLTTVDRFKWSAEQEAKYPQGLDEGESFLSVFWRNLAEYKDQITACEMELGDLPELLPVDDKIELLFVDAPKSWRLLRHVLAHFGPHFLPGARLVFQDFLHIPSRQLIWLLMSIPGLRFDCLVHHGTAAAFTTDGPIVDLDESVPGHIKDLDVDALMALWNTMKPQFPEVRLGEVGAGMALELLEHGATAEAVQILDSVIADKPWASEVIREVDRLIPFHKTSLRHRLRAISDYLSFGWPISLVPDELRSRLPAAHVALTISELIDELDLSKFCDVGDLDDIAFHPGVLLAVLLYAELSGQASARKIERATHEDVAYQVLSRNEHPDRKSIAAFRSRNQKAIGKLRPRVSGLCE